MDEADQVNVLPRVLDYFGKALSVLPALGKDCCGHGL